MTPASSSRFSRSQSGVGVRLTRRARSALGSRPSPEAITVCDLTGTGAQDTAIATHALAAARAAGVGTLTRT